MPNIGIHIPNKGDFQRGLINNMGFDSATALFENMDKAYALRADGFEGIILGRPYNSDVMQYEPEWWAEEMARQIAYLEGEYGYRVTDHYTPANELNLAGEHQGPTSNSQEYWESEDAYWLINTWVYRWAVRFRQLCPWAVLHFPAFAYGHGEDELKFFNGRSGLEICRDAIDICDVYDGHYYWSPSEGKQWSDTWHGMRYVLHEGELQRIGLTKPFFISEFNVPFGGSYELTEAEAVGQVFAWHETISTYFGKRFLGDAWFIWDSLTADDHWSFPGFAIGPHTPEFLRLVAEYNHRQETPMADNNVWDWYRVWADYAQKRDDLPMFLKTAFHANLGNPMGPEYKRVIGGVTYVLQDFVDGIVYSLEGDWGHVQVIRRADNLPLV